MIKNYIFDFGKVIVEFEPEYMISPYIEDESIVKSVGEVVFDRFYWDKLDEGTITDDEVKSGICSRLPKQLHKTACTVYDHWYEHLPFVLGMPELIRDIKKSGGRLFLISNISKTFAAEYSNVKELKNLFGLFDGLVFSAPLGIKKPSKEIFNYLTEKYDINVDEAVFIDDNAENINGAQKIGIKGYLFDGDVQRLRESLNV